MEQASGSILTGIREFSTYLPLTALRLLILLSGENRRLVLLDYVDIYVVGDLLFPLVVIIIPKIPNVYTPLPLAVLSLAPLAVTI